MSKFAHFVPIILLLIAAPTAFASENNTTINNRVNINSNTGGNSGGVSGSTNSNVNISNDVNSNTNTTSTTKSSTSVKIDQSGEGTSQVTINGKEYKQEGPGKIEVKLEDGNEQVNTSSPSASANPTASSSANITNSTPRQALIVTIFKEILSFFKKLSFGF